MHKLMEEGEARHQTRQCGGRELTVYGDPSMHPCSHVRHGRVGKEGSTHGLTTWPCSGVRHVRAAKEGTALTYCGYDRAAV
jgi:hypothetical protein